MVSVCRSLFQYILSMSLFEVYPIPSGCPGSAIMAVHISTSLIKIEEKDVGGLIWDVSISISFEIILELYIRRFINRAHSPLTDKSFDTILSRENVTLG